MLIDWRAQRLKNFAQRDDLLALYAPFGLLSLPPTWLALVTFGYTGMYWALGLPVRTAFRLSGSSILTLGIEQSPSLLVTALMFSEATLGLILIALLISYLPTIYAAFSRREAAVTMLEVRAGTPPSAVEMIRRYQRFHGLDRLGELWTTWEIWFAEIEESHTSLPFLAFFRSPQPDHSWITAAGAVMDAAALIVAAVDVPFEPKAILCLRAGYLGLRRIADFFRITYNPDPHFPADSISVSRVEFDTALAQLADQGVPLKPDREKAWQDFAGWRVNYDTVLLALCGFLQAPFAPWSSDRAPAYKRPPIFSSPYSSPSRIGKEV